MTKQRTGFGSGVVTAEDVRLTMEIAVPRPHPSGKHLLIEDLTGVVVARRKPAKATTEIFGRTGPAIAHSPT